MKDLLRDQGKETGKETRLKSTQVTFSQSFPIQRIGKEKWRQIRHTNHYILPQHREKDFRIKEHSAIFCDERWLLCLDGLHWNRQSDNFSGTKLACYVGSKISWKEKLLLNPKNQVCAFNTQNKTEVEALKQKMNNKSTEVIKWLYVNGNCAWETSKKNKKYH